MLAGGRAVEHGDDRRLHLALTRPAAARSFSSSDRSSRPTSTSGEMSSPTRPAGPPAHRRPGEVLEPSPRSGVMPGAATQLAVQPGLREPLFSADRGDGEPHGRAVSSTLNPPKKRSSIIRPFADLLSPEIRGHHPEPEFRALRPGAKFRASSDEALLAPLPRLALFWRRALSTRI